MKLIHFYSDPAIGFPGLGVALHFLRLRARGFGVWRSDRELVTLGVWWIYQIQLIQIPRSRL